MWKVYSLSDEAWRTMSKVYIGCRDCLQVGSGRSRSSSDAGLGSTAFSNMFCYFCLCSSIHFGISPIFIQPNHIVVNGSAGRTSRSNSLLPMNSMSWNGLHLLFFQNFQSFDLQTFLFGSVSIELCPTWFTASAFLLRLGILIFQRLMNCIIILANLQSQFHLLNKMKTSLSPVGGLSINYT